MSPVYFYFYGRGSLCLVAPLQNREWPNPPPKRLTLLIEDQSCRLPAEAKAQGKGKKQDRSSEVPYSPLSAVRPAAHGARRLSAAHRRQSPGHRRHPGCRSRGSVGGGRVRLSAGECVCAFHVSSLAWHVCQMLVGLSRVFLACRIEEIGEKKKSPSRRVPSWRLRFQRLAQAQGPPAPGHE